MKPTREVLKEGARGAAVRQLQTMLVTLGASLVVDGIFGPITDDAVRDFQAWRRLVEDGIVGPKTWNELEQSIVRRQHMDEKAKSDRLRVLGEKAVEAALRWWHDDIEDSKKHDKSPDAYYNRTVIGTFISEGLGWRWEGPYEGDGDFEWCLAFVFACWPDIKEALRVVYGASTYRVDRYGSYRSAFGEPNPMPERETDRRLYMKCDEKTKVEDLPWEPRPGDIALVGKSGYGTHGVLVERFDKENGCLHTIEGNATGDGPHGEKQHGIIRTERFFGGYTKGTHIRRIVRPGLADLK